METQIRYTPFCDYYFLGTERIKLENIVVLVNDFNFFDIQATYKKSDGTESKGKFRFSELEIVKR